MRKIVLIIALLTSSISMAAPTPEQIFGSVFEFIINQIQKDKNGNAVETGKVILQDNNNRIILARLFLGTNNNDADSVSLPACGPNKRNKRVEALRFRVAEANVYLQRVRITYQNNQTTTVDVNDTFPRNTNSGWYDLPGKADTRCIKAIRVVGQAMANNPNKKAVLTFIGAKAGNSNGF